MAGGNYCISGGGSYGISEYTSGNLSKLDLSEVIIVADPENGYAKSIGRGGGISYYYVKDKDSSYFSPNWILELLALLKLELKSIVLLDGYTEKEKKSMQLLLKQETTVPIISFEQVANLSDLADLILTTHELQDDKHKQIILPMLPVIGVSGEIDFINKISQIISRRGIKGGVVYG